MVVSNGKGDRVFNVQKSVVIMRPPASLKTQKQWLERIEFFEFHVTF